MKHLVLSLAASAFALTVQAQTAPAQSARQEIAENVFLSGSNYVDYDRQLATQPLTPAPKGYEPYYMSHYGRHGSRWLLSDGDYMNPINTLRDAKRAGKLTAVGQEMLERMEQFYPTTKQRLGDLTTVGERQHHGIGRRMVQHFPELFKSPGLIVDARSTVVIRCILSMVAECEELMAANPTARIHNDVSESLQYYLNQPWSDRLKQASRDSRTLRADYQQRFTHPERMMRLLFNDDQYIYNNVKPVSLMYQLFEVASNMQSHDTDLELLSYFTNDEIYDQWRIRNIGWYLDYSAAPQSGGIMAFSQLNLLKNIIETADTVTRPQATLRFGHEVCVMPLAALLELGQCGASVENLDTLENVWRNYRIFPMGCNVQLVFYRPKKGKAGDVLVKALLNEREMSLPVPASQWPYYRWADLRDYYLQKIQKFEAE